MIHQKLDYIIAGAGLAGYTLLRKMITSGLADQKKILVIDRDFTLKNDKTWCFWTHDDPFAIQRTFIQWPRIALRSHTETDRYPLAEHQYYCIKSEAYLRACKTVIDTVPSIEWLQADIHGFDYVDGSPVVLTDQGVFGASFIFQSVLTPAALKSGTSTIQLKQHFLGWEIETHQDTFDTDEAMIMDFRTTQEYGFAFVYVLPYTKRTALIELTYFTESLLPMQTYSDILSRYINDHLAVEYRLVREEFGIIPMETSRYPVWWCPGVLNMGLAGGQCKPSTGYTFSRITRYCDQIVEALIQGDLYHLNPASPVRFQWYDRALLWLLKHTPNRVPGIFLRLFKRNDPDRMLAFLDERTRFWQELGIFYTTRWRYFIEALLRSLK
jgi:lycopene beta-cyclase